MSSGSGDLGDRQFWYDGKSVTLYDPATPFYATEAAPPDIDTMLRQARSAVGLRPAAVPISCTATRTEALADNLQYGFYLGLNDVDGRSCHTLAFVEQDIDWQIWIDTGPQLIPCKLVITYKTQPASHNSPRSSPTGISRPASPSPCSRRSCRRGRRRSRSRQPLPAQAPNSSRENVDDQTEFRTGTNWPACCWPARRWLFASPSASTARRRSVAASAAFTAAAFGGFTAAVRRVPWRRVRWVPWRRLPLW